jgi:hypothetical protein
MCQLSSRSSLRAGCAVFAGCTGIAFIALGAARTRQALFSFAPSRDTKERSLPNYMIAASDAYSNKVVQTMQSPFWNSGTLPWPAS